MIIDQQLYDESTHVRIVADREFNQESSVAFLEAGLRACYAWNRSRLLLHIPQAGPITLLGKVLMGFGMADAYERMMVGKPHLVRVAALGNADLVTEVRPVEQEFQARGLPFQTFDHEPEALSWLLMPD